MTEDEEMDLALQLSKQEASNTALRQQQEDENVMKAIQESVSSDLTLLSAEILLKQGYGFSGL